MQCLIFQEANPNLEKRLVLWAETNILLVSSLRDGLCLQPFEFVAAKKHFNKLSNSLMLLSEFSGANRALNGYLEFNPFDESEFLTKLDQALSLSSKEKEELMKQAVAYVEKTSTSKWVESFFKDLRVAYRPGRLWDKAAGQRRLDVMDCEGQFHNANKCVIFIDHECVPVLEYTREQSRTPTAQFLEDLRELVQDNRNIVVVFSNQSVDVVKEQFGGVGDDLWVAAESGYLYKQAGHGWKKLIQLANKVWLNTIYNVMQTFANNVDGASVEERESTLVWNYKNAEEEQGELIMKELYTQIKQMLGNCPVEIIQGKGYLEVKPCKLKKQKLLKVLLDKAAASCKIEWLLYIGADTANEKVYTYLNSKKCEHYFARGDNQKFICTLGKQPHSHAPYYVDDVEEVKLLVNRLRVSTQKRKKTRSYPDFKEMSPLNKATGVQPNKGSSINVILLLMHN